MFKNISFLFWALSLFIIGAGAFWYFGSDDSGAGVFALIAAGIFVGAASYNKWRNGKWLADFATS